jgi:hypothetical protein
MDLFWLCIGAMSGIVLTLCAQTLSMEISLRLERRRAAKRQAARSIPYCSLGMGEAPRGVLDLLKAEARVQSHGQR